jgi:hypothetical protein
VGPTVSRSVRTMGRPRPDRTDRPQTVATTTLPRPRRRCCHFPAQRFPPPRRRHPPPLMAIKGATPHCGALFSSSFATSPLQPPPYPSPLSYHGPPLQPLSDRLDHTPSTTPLSTTTPRHEMPTTTPEPHPPPSFPSDQAAPLAAPQR